MVSCLYPRMANHKTDDGNKAFGPRFEVLGRGVRSLQRNQPMTRPRRSLLFMPGRMRGRWKRRAACPPTASFSTSRFGGAGRQGGGARPDRQGDCGRRVRQARGADPRQQPRYALVGRRRHHGRQGAARRHPGSEDFHRGRSQRHREPPERHQRRHVDPGLGDARNRARRAGCRQARGGIEGSENRLAGFVFGPNESRGRRGCGCSRAARR